MFYLTLSWNQNAIDVVLGKLFVLQVFSLELLELGLTCWLLNASVVLFYDLSWANSNASSCSHFHLIGTSITVILSNLNMAVTLTMSRKFICENWSLHITQWMIICVALQYCPDNLGLIVFILIGKRAVPLAMHTAVVNQRTVVFTGAKS